MPRSVAPVVCVIAKYIPRNGPDHSCLTGPVRYARVSFSSTTAYGGVKPIILGFLWMDSPDEIEVESYK